MYIKNGEIAFNRHRGSGPREETETVRFPGAINHAAAVLRGFDVGFAPREDRYLGNLDVRLEATVDGDAVGRVMVKAIFGLRDWSNEWDDEYEGKIFFSVIAE
jgi:hypothetical protein